MESKEEALWGRVEMLRTQLKKNSLCVSPKRRGKSLNARQASNLKKKLENLEASARDLGKKILSRSATDSELIKISKEGLGPLLPRRRTNNREQVLDLDAVMPESKPTPFNFDQYWSNILSERNPDPYEPGLDESDPAGIESLPKVNISIDESINTQFTIGVEFEASLFDQVESLHYRSAAALFCPNDHSKKALKVDATGLFLCRCFMPKGWTFFQFSAKNKDGGTFDYPIYFIDKTGKAEVPGQSGKPQEHWVHEYSDLHDLFAAAAAVRSKNAASKTASKRVTKGTSKPKRAR